ncbi:MAG: four helix bundle protein [Patescibacteria group bacterium]|jgi:four helix bundle protein
MALLVDYRKLIVWQKGVDLVVEVYKLTELLPKSELYGLTSQIRRSAVSIPSNIAEGRRRCSLAEYRHFLQIAFGSGGELETQIEICKRLPGIKEFDYRSVDLLLEEVMKMLNKMINNRQVD